MKFQFFIRRYENVYQRKSSPDGTNCGPENRKNRDCPYTGDPDSFREVVEGCPAPILIAGCSKLSDADMFKSIEGAMQSGAKGLSIGRNAFQHKDPVLFVKAACAIVHDNKTAQEAMEILNEKS